MKRQKLVLNNPASTLTRNVPSPKLVPTTAGPIGRRAVPKQKLSYANPAAQQSVSQVVPDHHLGRFSVPTPEIVLDGPLVDGMLYFTRRPLYLLSGVWDRTSIAGENTMSYLSPSAHKPHPSIGTASPVPAGTVAIYLGSQRVTEWDGKGWARYVRPVFLIEGVQALAVGTGLFSS